GVWCVATRRSTSQPLKTRVRAKRQIGREMPGDIPRQKMPKGVKGGFLPLDRSLLMGVPPYADTRLLHHQDLMPLAFSGHVRIAPAVCQRLPRRLTVIAAVPGHRDGVDGTRLVLGAFNTRLGQ